MKKMAMTAASAMAVLYGPLAHAGLELGSGAEYSEGKYGSSQTTSEWVVPFRLSYRYRWLWLGAYVPFVSADGTTNTQVGALGISETSGIGAGKGKGGGGTGTVTTTTTSLRTVSQSQSGLGDSVLSAFATVIPETSGFGLDIGGKIKLVTADRSNDLITTGSEDYSVQADTYGDIGNARLTGSLGWTLKGDIKLRDDSGTLVSENPHNPWYASAGLLYPAAAATRIGISYDWREALFSDTDAASEATVSLQHRNGPWRMSAYTFAGFSDASPAWGIGANVSYRW